MDLIPKTQDSWQEWLMVGGYLAFLLLAVWGVFRSPIK